MTKPSNITGLLISVCLLLAVGLGCNQAKNEAPAAQQGQTNTAAPGTNSATSPPAEKDIAGNYSITGMNENGAGRYDGDLKVTKRDDVYQFSWVSGPNTYDGVGVRTGNTIGVSFTNGTEGKGCGVVLYEIKPGGNLNGKAGYWGANSAESEMATRKSGSDLEGTYDVSGTNPGGGKYTGTLDVKKDGEGFAFTWTVGGTIKGFGVRQANKVAVGTGGSKCAFVMYEANPDGSLAGRWGGQGSKTFGTENAVRK